MIVHEVEIPPHVSSILRKLPPDLKRSIQEALRALAFNPHLGEPLKDDLEGLWKYRVRRYRIVYLPLPTKRIIQIFAVGHRQEIYDWVSSQLSSS